MKYLDALRVDMLSSRIQPYFPKSVLLPEAIICPMSHCLAAALPHWCTCRTRALPHCLVGERAWRTYLVNVSCSRPCQACSASRAVVTTLAEQAAQVNAVAAALEQAEAKRASGPEPEPAALAGAKAQCQCGPALWLKLSFAGILVRDIVSPSDQQSRQYTSYVEEWRQWT